MGLPVTLHQERSIRTIRAPAAAASWKRAVRPPPAFVNAGSVKPVVSGCTASAGEALNANAASAIAGERRRSLRIDPFLPGTRANPDRSDQPGPWDCPDTRPDGCRPPG